MIKFNEPYITGNEKKYMDQVFDNGIFGGNGPFTKRCSKLLENRFNVPKVLLTHSCTAGLEMMPLLYDLQPGDEVILPSYTFVSTASAFARAGAKLVFAEIDPKTFNMSVEDTLRKVTENTKVVIPIHYAGISAEMTQFREKLPASIKLLEDAAQGLGTNTSEGYLGAVGDLGAISFHETKNIHCGLGGALCINDESLVDRAEDIWERGTDRQKMLKGLVDKYSWVELGSSFYPSELQAAFLFAQLEFLDENIAYRKTLCEAYENGLSSLKESDCLDHIEIDRDHEHNYHAFHITLPTEDIADRTRESLKEEGIHAYIGYVPLHTSKYGRKLGYKEGDLPITEDYAARILRLPLHNKMSLEDVGNVCQNINRTLLEG